jgi:protease-4
VRFILTAIIELLQLLWSVLFLPLRLAAIGRRPEYVKFRLTGDPPYRRVGRPRWRPFRQTDLAAVLSLETLRRQMERLGRDRRIRGVIFEVDGLEMSPAKRDALTALFDDARRAGKQVVGYGVTVSNAEYELLCAADRIYVPAAGRVDLTGFAAEISAIGKALSRLGVRAHFIRRGDYKTAPELFTREDVSAIQRETVESILDERHRHLIQAIARGRRMTEADARARIDRGPFSARRALAEGLIDGLCSEPELPQLLAPGDRRPRGDGAPAETRVGTYRDYLSTVVFPPIPWRRWLARPRLGVVSLNGMIAEGRGGSFPAGPVIAGSWSVIAALDDARRSARVPAVVLYVSSPGGSAPASEMILEAVRRLAAKKPVVAYFDRVAASGGYMAVCGAKEVWAGRGALAGSIGVFAGKFDAGELFARLGVHRELLTRGQNAGLQSPARPFTEHERISLEAEVEEIYQSFLEIVAHARGRTKDEVHARAEGRVYSADRALDAGLVDRVGGFDEACRRALELAGRAPKGPFEVALFGARPPRFGLLGMLRQWSGLQMLALWYPWISLDGTGASGGGAVEP